MRKLYSPKTPQEKAEAFKLLDELLNELAREEALREVVADLLDPQLPWPRSCATPRPRAIT